MPSWEKRPGYRLVHVSPGTPHVPGSNSSTEPGKMQRRWGQLASELGVSSWPEETELLQVKRDYNDGCPGAVSNTQIHLN